MSATAYPRAAQLAGIHCAILCFDTEIVAGIHIAPARGVVEAGVRIDRIPAAAERVNIQMLGYLYRHIDLLATGGCPLAMATRPVFDGLTSNL